MKAVGEILSGDDPADTVMENLGDFLWSALGGLDIQAGRFDTAAAQDILNASASLYIVLMTDPAALGTALEARFSSFIDNLNSDDPYVKAQTYTNLALVVLPLGVENAFGKIGMTAKDALKASTKIVNGHA